MLEQGRATLARETAGRFPHAVLIGGPGGVGKRAFAHWLVESLLCQARTADGACGQCDSCRQLLADSHPDYRMLEPEGASATMRIDAVRSLVEWLQLTAGGDGHRAALLIGADTLNHSAANALLKTLEEPGERGLLILVADKVAALPATIRSRCQTLVLGAGPAERETALAWLQDKVDDPAAALDRARGRPFAALTILDESHENDTQLLLKAWQDLFLHRASIGRIVDSVAELPTNRCLETFSHWIALTLRHRAGLAVQASESVREALIASADTLDTQQWFTLHDHLARLHRMDGASFKTKSVLEGAFSEVRLLLLV